MSTQRMAGTDLKCLASPVTCYSFLVCSRSQGSHRYFRFSFFSFLTSFDLPYFCVCVCVISVSRAARATSFGIAIASLFLFFSFLSPKRLLSWSILGLFLLSFIVLLRCSVGELHFFRLLVWSNPSEVRLEDISRRYLLFTSIGVLWFSFWLFFASSILSLPGMLSRESLPGSPLLCDFPFLHEALLFLLLLLRYQSHQFSCMSASWKLQRDGKEFIETRSLTDHFFLKERDAVVSSTFPVMFFHLMRPLLKKEEKQWSKESIIISWMMSWLSLQRTFSPSTLLFSPPSSRLLSVSKCFPDSFHSNSFDNIVLFSFFDLFRSTSVPGVEWRERERETFSIWSCSSSNEKRSKECKPRNRNSICLLVVHFVFHSRSVILFGNDVWPEKSFLYLSLLCWTHLWSLCLKGSILHALFSRDFIAFHFFLLLLFLFTGDMRGNQLLGSPIPNETSALNTRRWKEERKYDFKTFLVRHFFSFLCVSLFEWVRPFPLKKAKEGTLIRLPNFRWEM